MKTKVKHIAVRNHKVLSCLYLYQTFEGLENSKNTNNNNNINCAWVEKCLLMNWQTEGCRKNTSDLS